MKIIITGGTGLIGRGLIRELSRTGSEAIVLSRHPEGKKLWGNARLVKWDGETPHGWQKYVDEADGIVNLAGENIAGPGLIPDRWTADKKKAIVNSRLKCGRAVNSAVHAADNPPEVLVQASAIGYYGPSGDEALTEEAESGSDYLAGVAREWEKVTSPVEKEGVRRTIIRTGMVLSERGGVLPRFLLPMRAFVGGPFGDGNQWHSWIHIEDEVRAIRFLLEEDGREGPFNLTAPNPCKNREFVRELGHLLHRPTAIRAPEVAVRLGLGEVSTLVLDGQRVIPAKLTEAGFEFNHGELRPALENLLSAGKEEETGGNYGG